MRIGRTRRPDELTPREREVLDLVRLGLTNEEIAERLGISLDGAKYHVSQILGKLGVESREEAAAVALAERRTWWAFAPLWAKAAGVAVVAASGTGLGVLAWGVAVTGGPAEEATPAPAAAQPPRIGADHWHATYEIWICGERQPDAPAWEAGVHTHGDGVVHIHPFTSSEEGEGARLVKWFESGGGLLTDSSLRVPGSRRTVTSGDTCGDGSAGVLHVLVNSERLADWDGYIPQDGDRVKIVFGAESDEIVGADRTIIPAVWSTRTIEVSVTDDGTEMGTRFEPDRIEVAAGETVTVAVHNAGQVSHGFRAAGSDGAFGTKDDYVSDPEIIVPGDYAFVVVRLDVPGEVHFRDETLNHVTGTIVAPEEPEPGVVTPAGPTLP